WAFDPPGSDTNSP
nr:endothelium-derived relating factor, nitric oxide synthase [human, Peptide Partial, 13 aa] [Homo sapiens]